MLSFGKLGEKVLIGVGLVLVVGLAMGTNSLSNISWDKLKESHWKMVTGKSGQEMKMEAAEKGQSDEAPATEKNGEEQEATATMSTAKGTVQLALYFVDGQGETLKAEERKIPNQEGIARAAIEELIVGPTGKNLQGTIPEGTALLDINIADGLCTVDFSKEIRDNHWGGSSGELLTVYSIVNVLTQFPTVEKVQFMIEGQKADTLVGHVDLSEPLERNEEIIK